MITILYFARFREKLGLDREELALPGNADATVQTVLDLLVARGGVWQEQLGCERGVLVAINQEMAARESSVYEGDELAVFPPVTGG
jgi:molybdopterin synthase sulfur carrier subunit